MKGVLYPGEDDYPRLTWKLLVKAHKIALDGEPIDEIYQAISKIVDANWHQMRDLAVIMGGLLMFWNSAFYRTGDISFAHVENTLLKHTVKLDEYRTRVITTISPDEFKKIGEIYYEILYSFGARKNEKNGDGKKMIYSPVSAAKAMHLLCPNFFPLWDSSIAKAYGCYWDDTLYSFPEYWKFISKSKKQVELLRTEGRPPKDIREIPVLRLIDQYNYLCYTKKKCP